MPHENHISKKMGAEELLVLQAILVLVGLQAYLTQIKFKCTYSVNHARLALWNKEMASYYYYETKHFRTTFTRQKKPESMHCHSSKQCCQIENAVINTVNPIISFSITYKTWAMLWLRFYMFNPRPVHTAHVDKMTVRQFFSKHSGFSTNAPCSCSHISQSTHQCSVLM